MDGGHGQHADGTTSNPQLPAAIDCEALKNETIVSFDFGAYHCIVLTASRKIFSWGYNSSRRLGNGNTTDRSTPDLLLLSLAARTSQMYFAPTSPPLL